MLFNEPKLLKCLHAQAVTFVIIGFSALQRAEIAEILVKSSTCFISSAGFSALQRAEIAEIGLMMRAAYDIEGFSALQRAEIAEMAITGTMWVSGVSGFSALQRAEIAEIVDANSEHFTF